MREMKLYKDKNWLYQKYWIEKLSSCEMAKLCNISPQQIRTWMEKFNIKRRSMKEALILRQFLYRKGETMEEKYGIKRSKEIKEKLRLAFLKYKFNEKAFDILTPQVAYWLGFIYADGYINEKIKNLAIILHKKDKIILEEFKIFLQANHPINPYVYSHDNYKPRHIIRFQVFSGYLIKRLNELGVHQNKTGTIKFPYFLPEKLYPDFIRGYFDGDGSLTTNSCGQPVLNIASNYRFLKQIQKILIKNCELKETKIYNYKNGNSALLKYGGNKQIKKIKNYLIQNKGFFLPRKLGKIGRWLPSQM